MKWESMICVFCRRCAILSYYWFIIHACHGRGAPKFSGNSSLKDRFPVDEVTVSVDEETGKSVFIDRENLACLYRGFGVRKHNR